VNLERLNPGREGGIYNTGEGEEYYEMSVGKPERKRPLQSLNDNGNIKMETPTFYFKE